MGSVQPFQPSYTVAITAGTTAVSQSLAKGGSSVLLTNGASDYAFVRLGTTGVLATTSDIPVPAGSRLLLHAPDTVTAISVLLNSGSGIVFASRGTGTSY